MSPALEFVLGKFQNNLCNISQYSRLGRAFFRYSNNVHVNKTKNMSLKRAEEEGGLEMSPIKYVFATPRKNTKLSEPHFFVIT